MWVIGELLRIERLLILGPSGSGKTVLALQLASRTGGYYFTLKEGKKELKELARRLGIDISRVRILDYGRERYLDGKFFMGDILEKLRSARGRVYFDGLTDFYLRYRTLRGIKRQGVFTVNPDIVPPAALRPFKDFERVYLGEKVRFRGRVYRAGIEEGGWRW